MGPLQKSVYWRLSLNFFFTAFMFFSDMFIVNNYTCLELSENKNQNYTFGTNQSYQISERSNSAWINITGTIYSSTCVGKGFSYGQMMYMIGLLIGSLLGGTLSDRYGKKFLLVGSTIVQAVIALMSAFLPYTNFHLAARCIAGIACCVINICSFSLGVEWSLPKYRMWPPALLSFAFSLGLISLAAVAYLTSSWMQFHLAIAIPQIICLPLYFSIPESPRWLLLKRKLGTLEEYSSRSPEDSECLRLLLNTVGNEVQNSNKEPMSGEKHFDFIHFKSSTIILRLIIMSYIGFASALTYFGICFNVGNFGVNIYLAQFISGLSETPSLLIPFLLVRFGRRPFSMVSLIMSGSACLLALLVSKFCDIPSLVMGLALMGKFCMQTTVFVSLLYGIELFPTIIRQKCVGVVNLWYRIGSILVTVVSPGDEIPLAAMISYGIGPILGAWLCLLLPETSGVPLPDTVLDCEMQHRQSLQFPPCCRKSLDSVQDKEIYFVRKTPRETAIHGEETDLCLRDTST